MRLNWEVKIPHKIFTNLFNLNYAVMDALEYNS